MQNKKIMHKKAESYDLVFLQGNFKKSDYNLHE